MGRRPIIGITGELDAAHWGSWIREAVVSPVSYTRAVERAGGAPVVLAPVPPSSVSSLVAAMGGLVFTGGRDVDPALYGERRLDETDLPERRRDSFEIELMRAALDAGIPVLAIGRGMHVLTLARGGALTQDLPSHRPDRVKYLPHDVQLAAGSTLGTLLGTSVTAPAAHHQAPAAGRLGDGVTLAGWSAADEVAEAVEVDGHRFAIGVHWHPEEGDDPRLLEALVVAAAQPRRPSPPSREARQPGGRPSGRKAGKARARTLSDIVTDVKPAAERSSRTRVLIAGVLAFTAVIASWWVFDVLAGPYGGTHAVDLTVYRDGGLIVRHVAPYFSPRTSTPLYSWGGYSALALKFTYPPFAAVAFAPLSYLTMSHLLTVSIIVNMAALPVALWFTFGALGERYRDRRLRLGVTLLAAAVTFWLQPEIRTIYLGQVNLVLMAAIMWDLCQPDEGRWWKGLVTGIAAGVKLTPLIFLPYLLVTRQFRQAAMHVAGFAATIVVGFVFLPGDSAAWWLHGLIITDGTRTGFLGWAGNQSLRAIITRFAGSVSAGQDPWLVAVVIATVTGIGTAYCFERAGHHVVAILVTALTGLLDSPVSWDHHWVWVAPGVAVAAHYAAGYWRGDRVRARWLAALAAGVIVVYGPWPDALWERARNLGNFSLGFLWAPPNTNPEQYALHGDQPWFVEYHWHGIWLLTGNAYILGGIALMALLAGTGWRLRKAGVSPVTARRDAEPAHIVTT